MNEDFECYGKNQKKIKTKNKGKGNRQKKNNLKKIAF